MIGDSGLLFWGHHVDQNKFDTSTKSRLSVHIVQSLSLTRRVRKNSTLHAKTTAGVG